MSSRLAELEERVVRIEGILTCLEVALAHSALRHTYARPGETREAGKRKSPFEGIQDFPENVVARVEEALKQGALDTKWCHGCRSITEHAYHNGTWRCISDCH